MRSRRAIRAFAGAAVALAAAASAASAARGSAAACPSLDNVIGFNGRVTVTVGTVASGQGDPIGTTTIQLGHIAQNIHVLLADRHQDAPYHEFNGVPNGGHVAIDDVYEDGSGLSGRLKYDGPLGASTGGKAVLAFDSGSCLYKLGVAFVVSTTFAGDEDLNYGRTVSFGATGSATHVPRNLTLHGAETLEAYPDCGDDPLVQEQGCAAIWSEWMPDLLELYNCHSAKPEGCFNNDNPKFNTPASFTWQLKPIFKKKKRS